LFYEWKAKKNKFLSIEIIKTKIQAMKEKNKNFGGEIKVDSVKDEFENFVKKKYFDVLPVIICNVNNKKIYILYILVYFKLKILKLKAT
jgi:tRNA1(Val) A37 N6-methylase TrmN6